MKIMKIMKNHEKLLLIALAINFVGCSDEKTENSVTTAAAVSQKTNVFKLNPTPEDYNSPEFFNFKKKSVMAKDVPTVPATFPDAALRKALISIGAAVEDANPNDNVILIDINRGGLGLNYQGITDLTGVEKFTSLIQLVVNGNNLTTINISGLPKLGYLDCSGNKNLKTVNLTAHPIIGQIWCQDNPSLTTLTLPTDKSKITGLWCYNCKISSLDVKDAKNMTDLFCQSNQLTKIDLGGDEKLVNVNCSANNFKTINFSPCTSLAFLYCMSTPLIDINIKNNNNRNITVQNFTDNNYGPNVHVDGDFLSIAKTYWPRYGSSVYVTP